MSTKPLRVAALLLLAAAAPSAATTPEVTATSPANGATGVAPDLPQIVVTFDREMHTGFSLTGLGGPWDLAWSADRRTLTMTRTDSVGPWPQGSLVTIVLNPPPMIGFFSAEGDPLGTYTFVFRVGEAGEPGAPTVTTTDPANGALGVSRDLGNLTITFSEAMADAVSIGGGTAWPISLATDRSWSGDGRTLTISRDDAGTPLPPSTVVTVSLNAQGSGFSDQGGTPLGTYLFSFTTASPGPQETPVVVSSEPDDGASAAGRFLGKVTLTFSKPMAPGSSITCTTGNWALGASWWSQDGRTFTLERSDPDRLLPAGERVELVLNPGAEEGFRDTDGNALATFVFDFVVESSSRVIKVQPWDSPRAFDWPYYLWVPGDLPQQTVLLVEPNNTGTTSDVEMVHDGQALSLIGWRARFAAELGVPLLVPTFPRPSSHWWIYSHALDRDSMTTSVEGLHRIDLQMIEMIDDARDRLGLLGHVVNPRVLMMGFSASGQFTSRFAILHPERTLAAAAGSPGGWPLAPVASWQGETLDYHVGIADAASLLGHPLDMAAVRSVPILLYMGDADTNDSVPYSDGYSAEQSELVNRLFGTNPVARWPHAEEIYRSAGMNATFVLYPGVGHTITEEMFDDVLWFFASHLPQRTARVRRTVRRVPGGAGGADAAPVIATVPPPDGGPPRTIHRDPPPRPHLPDRDSRGHGTR